MRILTLTLILCSVSACLPKMPPQPIDSQLTLPQQWQQNNKTTTDTSPRAEPTLWWQQVGDAQLDAYIAQALRYNADINIAQARVDAAQAQEAINRSSLFPSLSVGGSGAKSRAINAFGLPSTSAMSQPVFQAAYELDIFGKNRHAWQAKAWQTEAAKAQQAAMHISVTSTVVRLYVQLSALQAQHRLLEQTLQSRQQALKIAQDKARVGYSSQLELNQAQAEYAATLQQIPINQKNMAQTQHALSSLIGVSPQALMVATPLQQLRLPEIPLSLPSSLLEQRPDISAAAFALAANDEQLKSARAQFLPSLQLNVTDGVFLSSVLTTDPIHIWSVGGSILAPLFQGGRLQGQFEAATSSRDEAAWQYRATLLKALQEVEDILVAQQQLALQQQALQQQLVAMMSALKHANNRFHAGYASYLEVLDAQRSVYQLQTQALQLQADALTLRVNLYQALGGGWQEVNHKSTPLAKP